MAQESTPQKGGFSALAARRSWVLRGVIRGFSEEARTRGIASLTLVRFAFINCPNFPDW